MTKAQGVAGYGITEIWYYKQQVIVDKRSQSYYRADTGFMTMINRILRKFHIFERNARLRHHTRSRPGERDGKCGQMRTVSNGMQGISSGRREGAVGKCGEMPPRARDEDPAGGAEPNPADARLLKKPDAGSAARRFTRRRRDGFVAGQPKRVVLPSAPVLLFVVVLRQDRHGGHGQAQGPVRYGEQYQGSDRIFSTAPKRGFFSSPLCGFDIPRRSG